jgi:hypothetical protein
MRVAYEPLQGFSASPEGHYKGGVNDKEFSSGDAHPGYMNGPKEGEKDASFGVEKVTFKMFLLKCHHLKSTYRRIFKITIKRFQLLFTTSVMRQESD